MYLRGIREGERDYEKGIEDWGIPQVLRCNAFHLRRGKRYSEYHAAPQYGFPRPNTQYMEDGLNSHRIRPSPEVSCLNSNVVGPLINDLIS